MNNTSTSEAPIPVIGQTENKHLIQRFLERRETGDAPASLVIGHRGGYIDGPENTMRCFRAAVQAKLEGIEFDVSASSLSWILV